MTKNAMCRRIREARETIAEISQEEAARRLGLSLKGYRAYETFRKPSPRRLREIAAAFGLNDDYFLPRRDSELSRDHALSVAAEPDAGQPFLARLELQVQRLDEQLGRLERLLVVRLGDEPTAAPLNDGRERHVG